MRLLLVGTLFAMGVATTGATAAPASDPAGTPTGMSGEGRETGPLSLKTLCAHPKLSAADQADCRREAAKANSAALELTVRRTYEAKAGIEPGSSDTNPSPSTSDAKRDPNAPNSRENAIKAPQK